MAVPKPVPRVTNFDRPLLPEEELSRDERLALLRGHPAVTVRRRDHRPARPFVPTVSVVEDAMTLDDLLRLLGRDESDEEVFGQGEATAVVVQP